MAEIKIEDLMRSIRDGVREGSTQQSDSVGSSQDDAAKRMARLETDLTIISRTHNQLPPVTTYRTGLPARMELWIKRHVKRITHWFTWEQVNFNSSVHSALNSTLGLLKANEQRLTSLQNADSGVTSNPNLEVRITELESKLGLIENRFDGLLAERTAQIRLEHQQRIERLLNEQRACFRQLALEISESGVVADRAKRSMQLRLEELANRMDEMDAEQTQINAVGHTGV